MRRWIRLILPIIACTSMFWLAEYAVAQSAASPSPAPVKCLSYDALELQPASRLWSMGEHREAMGILRGASRRYSDPGLPGRWIGELLDRFSVQGDFQAIARTCVQIEQEFGSQLGARAYSHLRSSFDCGRDRIVAETLAEMLKSRPELVESRVYLAESYIRQRQLNKAVDALEYLLGIGKKSPPRLHRILYVCSVDPHALWRVRVQALRELSHLQPWNPQHMVNIARTCQDFGDMEAALRYARLLARRWPHSADAQYTAGMVFSRAGERENAINAYKKAMAAHPEFPGWWTLELAELCRKTARTQEAVRLLQDLVSRTGTEGMRLQGTRQLEQIYLECGYRDKALARGKECLECAPSTDLRSVDK